MSSGAVTVYVTKYALSSGITKETGCVIENGYASRNLGRLFVKMSKGALAQAKVKSLIAQKNKLSKLILDGFEIKEGRGPK